LDDLQGWLGGGADCGESVNPLGVNCALASDVVTAFYALRTPHQLGYMLIEYYTYVPRV
jgi:hypothetical protein